MLNKIALVYSKDGKVMQVSCNFIRFIDGMARVYILESPDKVTGFDLPISSIFSVEYLTK